MTPFENFRMLNGLQLGRQTSPADRWASQQRAANTRDEGEGAFKSRSAVLRATSSVAEDDDFPFWAVCRGED